MLSAMKAVVFLLFVFTRCVNGRGVKVKENDKIGAVDLLDLRNAMLCGMNGYWSYLGYGCWCGPSNLGFIATKPGTPPVDDVDNCCLKHDLCYEALAGQCGWAAGHRIGYDSSCTKNKTSVCSSENDFCGAGACKCDVEFVECLKPYPIPNERAKCPSQPIGNVFRAGLDAVQNFLEWIG
uniref:Phospholipase A2 domain-containing protein n=1 Tax=Panagrolaimus sp. JU765 TaxID=591449 RepID=A0AC34R616_9BILA